MKRSGPLLLLLSLISLTAASAAIAAAAAARATPASGSSATAVATAQEPSSSAQSLAAVSLPKCATAGLVMWLNAEGSGTAGSFYFKLEFTNLSGHACTLSGYPGVSAVNLAGAQIGSPASREVTGTPALVTLAPEAHTTALIHVTDVGFLPASSCHPVAAAGFRVYPPGQRSAKLVPFPFHTCALVGHSPMRVRFVKTE
jgi:hypothetical protein